MWIDQIPMDHSTELLAFNAEFWAVNFKPLMYRPSPLKNFEGQRLMATSEYYQTRRQYSFIIQYHVNAFLGKP